MNTKVVIDVNNPLINLLDPFGRAKYKLLNNQKYYKLASNAVFRIRNVDFVKIKDDKGWHVLYPKKCLSRYIENSIRVDKRIV